MTETQLRSILRPANSNRQIPDTGGNPQKRIQWSTQRIVVFK